MNLDPLTAKARAQALPPEQGLRLTPVAIEHLRKTLATEPSALGLRVGVKKSGCTGYGYVMDFAKTLNPDDLWFEQDGIAVICDQASLEFLKGSTLDYVVNGLSRLLTFHNPNVVDSCGCGESFSVAETGGQHG
ncbi:HesB/IscA family protein [Halothiobacillus sp. DCM-1]|uniref:HesB/IscA family protein n=1 Tax=Halothiobacillus sp. DCM-1 TaxID=3112558 RepID=UPI003248E8BD